MNLEIGTQKCDILDVQVIQINEGLVVLFNFGRLVHHITFMDGLSMDDFRKRDT